MRNEPRRVSLALLPTPIEPLPTLGKRLGVDLWVKRDDLTGVPLSGNKVRKLEYLLADAQAQGADVIVTCGGIQSNHARATAIAARRLGMDAVLLLRVIDPSNPPPVEGNVLLDRMVGAEIRYVSYAQYRDRKAIMAQLEAELRAGGRRPYLVPEGGSNALGSWGYLRAIEELATQVGNAPLTLVYATGSGGTGAGLVLGVKALGLPWRVVGVNVCDDRAYFERVIGEIVEDGIARYDLGLSFARSELEIVDGYVGDGYAKSRPEELRLLADVARTEALFLDPVYTGKAFHGMVRELEKDPRVFGDKVVFLHTGGIYGLFPKAAEIVAAV